MGELGTWSRAARDADRRGADGARDQPLGDGDTGRARAGAVRHADRPRVARARHGGRPDGDAADEDGRGRARSRSGRAVVGDPRHARPHHLVSADQPPGRPRRAGAERARQPARPYPAHLLEAGLAGARGEGADARAAGARTLDGSGRPHAPLPARRQRRSLQLRPHRPFPVRGLGDGRPQRGTRHEELPPVGRAGVLPAPAAAARTGGLPAARLDAGGAGRASDDARPARRGGRPA